MGPSQVLTTMCLRSMIASEKRGRRTPVLASGKGYDKGTVHTTFLLKYISSTGSSINELYVYVPTSLEYDLLTSYFLKSQRLDSHILKV